MENIIAILTSLVAILVSISTAAKNFSEAKKNFVPTKIKKQSSLNIEIIKLMEELKEILKADRIQIYDFHNGEHFANGRGAYKVSCSYEVVRIGEKGYQDIIQAIPLSMIPIFIQKLLDEKEMFVDDLEEIKDIMPSTYQFKKKQNIGAFYDMTLVNKQKEAIGFIGIQYSKSKSIVFGDYEKMQLMKYKYLIEEKLEEMISSKKIGGK